MKEESKKEAKHSSDGESESIPFGYHAVLNVEGEIKQIFKKSNKEFKKEVNSIILQSPESHVIAAFKGKALSAKTKTVIDF